VNWSFESTRIPAAFAQTLSGFPGSHNRPEFQKHHYPGIGPNAFKKNRTHSTDSKRYQQVKSRTTQRGTLSNIGLKSKKAFRGPKVFTGGTTLIRFMPFLTTIPTTS
jgi:hypothetical protein